MRVNIDEIKEQLGLERTWELAQDWVDAVVCVDRAGYHATGSAKIEVHLEKVDQRVLLAGRTALQLACPCGRCLNAVDLRVPVKFELTLVPSEEQAEREQESRAQHPDRGEGRAGGSFSADDADEETYTGKVIDLEPIIREQLLLALPGYPICRETCKGLCSVCGTNLNDRECGCDRHVPDPRWAGLKNVKLQ